MKLAQKIIPRNREARTALASEKWRQKIFYAFAERGLSAEGYGSHSKQSDNGLLRIEGMAEEDVERLMANIAKQNST